MSADVQVSVIIPTRNRADFIGDALASVLQNTTHRSFEVLVVDQSEGDRTGDIVRRMATGHPNLRYYYMRESGCARARNLGIQQASGALIAFTDDDCIAPNDWIETIADIFGAESDVDMLYGQVLRPAALVGNPGVLPTLGLEKRRRIGQKDGFAISGMSANMAVRRGLFEAIGLFDEILGSGGPLGGGGAELDFQYRAFLAGATCLLSPDVRVDHYGVRDEKHWPATARAYGIGDGGFYCKHARCGDLRALVLLVRRAAHMAGVIAAHRVMRRRSGVATYLKGYLTGVRRSLGYPVDRERRLYGARPQTA
jgi:glycosyltransferase involved in cell wall biosynthesis